MGVWDCAYIFPPAYADNGRMSGEQQVTVYLYTYWDADAQTHRTSTRFATIEAIRDGLGQPVFPSERKTNRVELIDGMFFVPPPEEFLEANPMAIETAPKVTSG